MSQPEPQDRATQAAGYLVGIGLMLTAVALTLMGRTVEIPGTEPPIVAAELIVPGAQRVALTDPPMINVPLLNQRCSDCHSLFERTQERDRELYQHTDIRLEHGSNDSCFNCHDKDDREKLVLLRGRTIGYDNVIQLCGQCHGPIFRDWGKGTHGKTLGYWNTDLGEAVKLICTQCHDPHHPAYDPMVPLPGPHTLRMGKQRTGHSGDLINERNPLQRWRLLEQPGTDEAGHGGDH